MKNPLSSKNLFTSPVFAISKTLSRYLIYGIIFTALTASLSSCKKETLSNPTLETQLPGENYDVSPEQIKGLDWQILERWDYENASKRLWKLRGITKTGQPTNYYILFPDVPDTIYWKPGYQKLDILNGIDAFYLLNKDDDSSEADDVAI